MVFSTTATHALRALAHLAATEGEGATLGRDLAKEVGVPAHYLAKVLATLARAGLLTASRGVRGGYRLARRPEKIALMEIVEPIEGKRVRPECLLRPDEPCREGGNCSAHGSWTTAKAAYLRFLEGTTLREIREKRAGRILRSCCIRRRRAKEGRRSAREEGEACRGRAAAVL